MNSEIQMCVEELKKVYGDDGVTSLGCHHTKHFFWRLGCVCKTFDDFFYVLTNVKNKHRSNRLMVFVRGAIAQAETLEQVRAIWPFMPTSWKEEKRILLRKGADASTSQEELYTLLSDFEVI